jgi:phosphatidylserine decarboxylase
MAKTLEKWLKTDAAKYSKMDLHKLSYTYFFRDPFRPNYVNSDIFYSPADGTILYQKFVKPDEKIIEVKGINYTLKDILCDPNYDQPSLVIGIFLSFYDPHIVRIPYKGTIKYEYLDSIESFNIPMLAVEKDILNKVINPNNMGYIKNNERMLIEVNSTLLDYEYYMCLIADDEVNVIAPFKQQQTLCFQNERFGIVRWGSQCDLILPLDDRFDFELFQEDHMHVEAGLDMLVKIIEK